jgi:Flp pilus assembly protein TadG
MRRLLSRFWSDRRGNIAIIFGLAIVPVMGAIGAAVDYSVANASRSAMQAALDNTALALSKQMPLSQNALDTTGWQYFTGNLGSSPIVLSSSNLVINSATTGKLVLDISGTYTMGLGGVLKLVGLNTTFPVAAHSEVQWGNSRLRVALVLDNTGSMSQSGKIGALKTATTNLINQLQGVVQTNGDVYISITPFVNTVNVGSSNYNATWIDWYDWEHDPNNASSGSCSVSGHSSQSSCGSAGTCSKSGYTTQSTCTAAGTCSISSHTTQSSCTAAGTCSKSQYTTQSTCTSAGTCSKSQYTTQSTCHSHSGIWTSSPGTWTGATWTVATWTPASWTFDHSQWNGCVADRGTPLNYNGYTGPGTAAGSDQDLSAPSTTAQPNPATAPDSSKYPAEQSASGSYTLPWAFSSCPAQQVIPLTYDWTALKNAVQGMSPNGSTDQPIGVVMGWLSLVGGGPFPAAPAMDTAHYTYNQYIILLSDGLNTQDRWQGDGSTTNTGVDSRMYYKSGNTVSGTCQNAKNAGIKIYAVQVNTGGDPLSTLMQNCASDPSMFFMLTSSSEIVATFQQIGTALANLHLSK